MRLKMKKCLLFLVFFLFYFCQCAADEENEVFVPTKHWKTIKKDQAIPAGLHVRLNLETGLREAKLLDDNEPSSKSNALTTSSKEEVKKVKIFQTAPHVDGIHILKSDDGEETVFANGKLTSQQLQDAMQNFKFEDVEVASEEDIARVKEKFRSLPELKEDLADLNLGMRSESEEIKELMERFLKAPDTDEKLSVLEDLEFLVHHVDAAQDFVQNNGIRAIIIPSLNSSELQSASVKLIGAAGSGNPMVQSAALKEGVLSQILRLIAVKGCDSVTKLNNICKTSVYAISCLIRNFPAGQKNFLNEGGLSVFSKIFDQSNMDVRIKIITLFHDLISEPDTISLKKRLVQNNWCDKIHSLLLSPHIDRHIDETTSQWAARVDHDVIEKIISVMIVMGKHCKDKFKPSAALLQEFIESYKDLISLEQITLIPEDFYMKMLHLSYKLARLIDGQDEL